MNQKTLVLIKPDAMERGLIGEIISRFEQVGLRLVNCKIVQADGRLAAAHYPVTEEWYKTVGERSKADFEKYGADVKEALGSDNPLEIGKMIHGWNKNMLVGSAVIAMVWEGVHAVEAARKISGPTIPLIAPPGTIRGDFATHSAFSENYNKIAIRNLVHTSGDEEEAEREIKLWFGQI